MQLLLAVLAATGIIANAAPSFNISSLRSPSARAGYRLDDVWYPWSYNITIKPDFPVDSDSDVVTFTGEVSMEGVFEQNVKQIPIHAGNNLRIHSVKLVYPFPSGNEIGIVSTERDEERELLLINVANTQISSRVIATFKYTATIVSGMEGFFKTLYEVDGRKRLFMGTHFAPTLARYAFPCLDEPRFKAAFAVGVYAPRGYSALSNTPLDERLTRRGSEFSLLVFKQTPAIPPHLLSLVVFEDDSYSSTPYGITTTSGVTIFGWGPKSEITAGRLDYALSVTYQVLDLLQGYLGVSYVDGNVTKVDLAVTPNLVAPFVDTSGVLEFKANTLLVDPQEGTQRDRQAVEDAVAYQLAQDWFGNRVTPSWWSDAWLSEGTSRFLQYWAVGQRHPDWRADERFVVEQQQRALERDALVSARALTGGVDTPTDAREKIDNAVTAAKGAAVLHMLRYAVGEKNLQSTLADLILRKDHGVVTNDDLLISLGENLPSNFSVSQGTFLASWTSQPGFPVITLTRDYTAQTATASQARFIGNGQPVAGTYTYTIPIALYSAGEQRTAWLDRESVSLSGFNPSFWVIINSTGYFRVNYDAANWALLSGQLHVLHEGLTPLDRAQLVDDALALARAGTLRYETALDVVSYLEHETDYVPWTAAFNALHFLRRMLGAYDTDGAFKGFILELLGTVYAQLGFSASGGHLEKLLRARVVQWACLAGAADCIGDAQTRFNAYVQTGSRVDPDLRRVVYCIGVRHGSDGDWQDLWATLSTVTNPSERSDIIFALGCTQDIATLDRYLNESLEMAPPDAAEAFNAIYSNPIALTSTLDFLIGQFNTLVEVFGGVRAAVNAVDGIADYITTDADALKVRRLAEAYPELGSVSSDLYSVASNNAQWVRLYKDEVLSLVAAQTRRMRAARSDRRS